MDINIIDRFLYEHSLFEASLISLAKGFRAAKLPEKGKLYQAYVIDSKTTNSCFILKYVDNLTAEQIAEKENIDPRTVYKRIDSEMLDFGYWLYENVYIPSKKVQ